jgi:cytochrome oxidase assembly protein ShyY1
VPARCGPAGTVAGVYRFLLTRQWVILALIALAVMPTMVKLGFWQLHRHESKVAQNALISANLNEKPLDVTSLTSPGHVVPESDHWRRTSAVGTFDTAHEVIVRRRTSNDDEVGYFVLTPLIMKDGRVVLVNRGWIPTTGAQQAFPKIPAPPSGEVTITGRLMADETTAASGIKDIKDLPPRQVMLINSRQQAQRLHRTVLGGYMELTSPTPKGDSPQQVAEPDHSSIGPHMAYAVQWWLFTAGVPIGWVILVRREKRDRLEAAAAAAKEAVSGEPEPEPAAV